MLASLQMSSFMMWSFIVLPLAHLSILISVVWGFVHLFLNRPAFRPMCHCWLDYDFVDIVCDLHRHLLVTHDSWHFCTSHHIHSLVRSLSEPASSRERHHLTPAMSSL